MNELLDDDRVKTGRPTFLTILCILTWIGSAAQFGWLCYLIMDTIDRPRNEVAIAVLALLAVGSVLTSVGAFRMFRLQKGLALYLIGEVIPPVTLVMLCILYPPRGMFFELVYVCVAIVLAISILFIFFYVRIILRNKALFDERVAG